MAIHAARTRGCRVTAITVSREQYERASARVAREGLAHRVTIQFRDYRTLDGSYDKIVSIEPIGSEETYDLEIELPMRRD
jgi:cyclopropane-fatty-acyl-phospholipid synthase